MDINVSASPSTVQFVVLEPEVEISIPDWGNGCGVFNDFFQKESTCYDGEKEMYDNIQMEAYNNFGVDMNYYTTTYDTSYDEIFGEDNNRSITSMFEVSVYYELPKNTQLYSRYGIEGIDNFHMYINKTHFTAVTELSGTVLPNGKPQVGDIIQKQDEELYYEIIDAKDKEDQFLQAQYAWDLIVRPYRDYHMLLSGGVSADSISAFVDQPDILEINDYIDTEKIDIIFN